MAGRGAKDDDLPESDPELLRRTLTRLGIVFDWGQR
jgi:hypothetical protein